MHSQQQFVDERAPVTNSVRSYGVQATTRDVCANPAPPGVRHTLVRQASDAYGNLQVVRPPGSAHRCRERNLLSMSHGHIVNDVRRAI